MTSRALTALVLAGGEARRLGGEKARRRLGGRTLIARVMDVASALSDDVVLLDGRRGLTAAGARRVGDWPGVPGPLGALGAGLDAARHDWSVLLAVDQPFVDGGTVARLLEALPRAGAPPAVVFAREGVPEPFPGLYHRAARATLAERAAAGRLSVRGLLDAVAARRVEAAPTDVSLEDVDTPCDLARARRELPTP